MAPSAKLKALVDRMPDHDGAGRLTNIDKDKVETAVAEIHKGGRHSLVGLIDLLVEPGKGNDIKPHYALHVLAVHVCKLASPGAEPADDKPRAAFARTVAAQMAAKPKGVQRYLIRQLQVAGGKEVVPALGKALLDPDLCEPAAQALLAIRDGAAEALRAALPTVKAKSRRTILQGLAVLGDRKTVGAFRKALGDPDRDVRIAAALGLANAADAASADALLKAADGQQGWERIQHTKACLVLADNLLAAGDNAAAGRIYAHLRDTRAKPSEAYIRQAAERALAKPT